MISFQRIRNGLRRALALILPMFARVREHTQNESLFWVLHAVTLGVILIVLEVVHIRYDFQSMLESVPLLNQINQIWLPLLFLMFYLLCWLVWWFWRLLSIVPEASPFPDIDRAWDEAITALSEKHIDVTDFPLFLVLGRPEEGEEVLFSGTRLQVAGSPRREDAPLHVYAGKDAQGREAVYVTCVGASLSGFQSLILTGELDLSAAPSTTDPVAGGSGPMTMMPRNTLMPESEDEAKQVLDRYRVIKAIEDAAKGENRADPLRTDADHPPEPPDPARRSARDAAQLRRRRRGAHRPAPTSLRTDRAPAGPSAVSMASCSSSPWRPPITMRTPSRPARVAAAISRRPARRSRSIAP